MEALRNHRWSGNVRELRNVVESALAMGNLTLEGISPAQIQDALRTEDIVPYRRARAEAIATFERRYLSHLIEATGGNASGARARRGHGSPLSAVAAAQARAALRSAAEVALQRLEERAHRGRLLAAAAIDDADRARQVRGRERPRRPACPPSPRSPAPSAAGSRRPGPPRPSA